MAMELLGASAFPHVVIVCVLAYVLSGHRSIYGAQRVVEAKSGRTLDGPIALRDLLAPPPAPPAPPPRSTEEE